MTGTEEEPVTVEREEHVKTWLRLLAPFIPHLCEEAWHMLGESPFISLAEWPKAEKETIDIQLIELEENLRKTMEDVEHVSALTGCQGSLYVYTISDEEFQHFTAARGFLRKELGFNEVDIFRADDDQRYDPHNKAERARLGRTGIYLE